MKNGYLNIVASGPRAHPGSWCTLLCFWHVDVDQRYRVHRRDSRDFLVLIRTLEGSGEITLTDGKILQVRPNEVLLLENNRISQYRTLNNSWHFFWFEFKSIDPPLTPGEILYVPNQAWEVPFFDQLRTLITFGPLAASELFGGYLYSLKAAIPENAGNDPRIAEALMTISRRLPQVPTVKELSRKANLCERRFRQLFCAEVGMSPKKYCDELRLQLARELLSTGSYNIKELSELLGFSSPYAFSSSFKQHYGTPPSKISP